MKLEVVIERVTRGSQRTGILEAFVIQEGRRSPNNLLRGRSLTNINSAKMAIKLKLWQELSHSLSESDITWTVNAI